MFSSCRILKLNVVQFSFQIGNVRVNLLWYEVKYIQCYRSIIIILPRYCYQNHSKGYNMDFRSDECHFMLMVGEVGSIGNGSLRG